MTQAHASQRIRTIASRVARLRPDWRDPERYFENRDMIERELRSLASSMEQAHG